MSIIVASRVFIYLFEVKTTLADGQAVTQKIYRTNLKFVSIILIVQAETNLTLINKHIEYAYIVNMKTKGLN